MEKQMPEIFTQDQLRKYLKERNNIAYVDINNDGDMRIIVCANNDRNDIISLIPIKELNIISDYSDHVAGNFRKSVLSSAIEAYDDVDITQEKLDKMYCAAGLASEAGEINKIMIRNFFFSKEINKVDIVSENSDLAWYQVMLARLLNIKFIDIFKSNIIKLNVRYPTKDIKLNKDDDEENRQIAEYLNQ